MIRVSVPDGATMTPEATAAVIIRASMISLWPQAASDDTYQITLLPNAFCPGQKRSEIDLILIAECPEGAAYVPTEPFTGRDEQSVEPDRVIIRSLMACIEVKEHSAENVEFRGTKVWVRYADAGWSGATDQSHEQTTSVASFLKRQNLRPPLVRNAIWLANVHPHEHTAFCSNVVLANLRWDTLLQALLSDRPPYYSKTIEEYVVDDFHLLGDGDYSSDRPQDVETVFLTRARPSELDQPRLNRLSREQSAEAVKHFGLENIVGKKLLRLRGAGGTGKSVLLLQLARHLYETQDARIVLLTYNRTLVADITRLLFLLRLHQGGGDRTLVVQTVHSFLWEAADALCGVPNARDGGEFGTHYDAAKRELLEMLRSGALTGADVAAKRDARDGAFFYDYVFVDEGQDFPDDERDLLILLFGHQNLVISEGAGQLIRRLSPTDWRGTLKRTEVAVHTCGTCLRMKGNVARFARRFAEALGAGPAQSVPEPNDSVSGGRIIVVDGEYFDDATLHNELTVSLRAAHNFPIDHLFCVPPAMVERGADGEQHSTVAEALKERGLPVWDAVGEQARSGVPKNLEACRVVTYESCRGLEGWVVVLCRLDTFFNEKRDRLSAERGDSIETAALWILMAAMRAMDTLVITLTPGPSFIRTALEAVAPQCRDFLEWRQQAQTNEPHKREEKSS